MILLWLKVVVGPLCFRDAGNPVDRLDRRHHHGRGRSPPEIDSIYPGKSVFRLKSDFRLFEN